MQETQFFSYTLRLSYPLFKNRHTYSDRLNGTNKPNLLPFCPLPRQVLYAGKPVHRAGSSAFLKVTNRIALKSTVLGTQIVTLGFYVCNT